MIAVSYLMKRKIKKIFLEVIFNTTLDSIRARDLDQGEEEEEGEAGKSGLNLINK